MIDFCKTVSWIISDGTEKLPESFDVLADRIFAYWLYEIDSETDEERKYSYIRLYQTICVLRVFLTEQELEDRAFSAVEQNYSNAELICLISQQPGITSQSIMESCVFSPEDLFRRTDTLCRDGFLSTRRSGSEQYYFLTNAGETLRQFLSGWHERHFFQKHWSYDRVNVLIIFLRLQNKSNQSFNFQQVIKAIGSLSERDIKEIIEGLVKESDRNTYMAPIVSMIKNEYLSLSWNHTTVQLEKNQNWFWNDIISDQTLITEKYLLDRPLSIDGSIDKHILSINNWSNIYE